MSAAVGRDVGVQAAFSQGHSARLQHHPAAAQREPRGLSQVQGIRGAPLRHGLQVGPRYHAFLPPLSPPSTPGFGLTFVSLSVCAPRGSALLAVRQAVAAGASQKGNQGWVPLSSPATVDKVAMAADIPVTLLRH